MSALLSGTILTSGLSGAALLLGSESDGLAIDFTVDEALVRDSTGATSFEGSPNDLLTYTAPSPKMVWRGGTLQHAPHNLFTNSEFPNGVTDANIRGGLVSATTFDGLNEGTGLALDWDAVTTSFAYKSVGTIEGELYRLSVFVRMDDAAGPPVFGSSTSVDPANDFVLVRGSTHVSPDAGYLVEDYGDGLYRVSVVTDAKVSAHAGLAKYGGHSSRTFKVSGFQIQKFPCHDNAYLWATNAARFTLPIDHDPLTDAALGILVEGQRTNLVQKSSNVSAAPWSKSPSLTVANATSILSGYTAVKATGGGVGSEAMTQSATLADTAEHCLSILVEQGTAPIFTLGVRNLTDATWSGFGNFTWATELFSAQQGVIASGVDNLGTGPNGGKLRRVWIAFTSAVAGKSEAAYFYPNSTPVNSNHTFIHGVQIEAGAFPTSFITTATAQVTRARDDIQLLTTAIPYNASEGTIIGRGSPVGSSAIITGLDDTTTTERVLIQIGSVLTQTALITDGGVTQAQFSMGAAVVEAPTTIGCAFKLDDVAGCANGGTIFTDATATMPTVTRVRFGSYATGVGHLNGHLKMVKYLPRRVTNIELQAMTA